MKRMFGLMIFCFFSFLSLESMTFAGTYVYVGAMTSSAVIYEEEGSITPINQTEVFEVGETIYPLTDMRDISIPHRYKVIVYKDGEFYWEYLESSWRNPCGELWSYSPFCPPQSNAEKGVYRFDIYFDDGSGFILLDSLACEVIKEVAIKIPLLLSSPMDGWEDVLEVDNSQSTSGNFSIILYNEGRVVGESNYEVNGLGYSSVNLTDLVDASCGIIVPKSMGLNFRLTHMPIVSGLDMMKYNLSSQVSSKMAFYFSNFWSEANIKAFSIMNSGEEIAEITLHAYGDGGEISSVSAVIAPMSNIFGYHTRWFPDLSVAELNKIIVISNNTKLQGITITSNDGSRIISFSAVSLD